MDKLQAKGGNEEEGSFNDSELQDIMSEIESLESEYEEEVAPTTAPKAVVKQATKNVDKSESKVKNLAEELGVKKNKKDKTSITTQMVEETVLGNEDEEFDREVDAILAEKDVEVDMDHHNGTQNNVVALSSGMKKTVATSSNAATKSSMEFSVSGDMVLDLTFNVSGQCVQIAINQENGFVIQMEGGMTFTIPLSNVGKTGVKKAV